MKDRIVWVGRHEGLLRDVARGGFDDYGSYSENEEIYGEEDDE